MNVSLFKMQLLEHVVSRKRQQKTKRTKTKNNNNKEILFNIEIACVSYVSIDILYIFCNVCIKKNPNEKRFYNYYYYTLYL